MSKPSPRTMIGRAWSSLCLVLAFASLVHADAAPDPTQPAEAIQLAAEAEGRPVQGTFILPVKAGNVVKGLTYLNSETDYRDQRCLTVVLTATAARALGARLHGPPQEALLGRSILVRGAAQRVRIDLMFNGTATGKYYYQTHIRVSDAAQVGVQ